MFDRKNSTLGIMDDLQIAIHSYDGCNRGCPGCLVDAHFKKRKMKPILTDEQMVLIHQRVSEYFKWTQSYLNNKEDGYFGKNGYKVNHFSYTFRFGNHSELEIDTLKKISDLMNAPFKVFSTAPTSDISKFHELSKMTDSRLFLEIIYDPIADSALDIRNMILEMRKYNISGYPEVLITQRLLSKYKDPVKFVKECIEPMGDIETQMQFGRYTPSKTRNFNTKQVVSLDHEVEWLATVAKEIVSKNYNIHPIPIAEYAVTFLDEYNESKYYLEHNHYNEIKFNDFLNEQYHQQNFNTQIVKDKTRDIFLTSLYIDDKLDLYVWSESMGQHVLDHNFGFPKLGNIKDKTIEEIVTDKTGVLEQMLNETVKHLIKHPKCSGCAYKSFCASHAIPFFRKSHQDNGKHCYGYLPVIREFQKSTHFLQNMIDGFKKLDF